MTAQGLALSVVLCAGNVQAAFISDAAQIVMLNDPAAGTSETILSVQGFRVQTRNGVDRILYQSSVNIDNPAQPDLALYSCTVVGNTSCVGGLRLRTGDSVAGVPNFGTPSAGVTVANPGLGASRGVVGVGGGLDAYLGASFQGPGIDPTNNQATMESNTFAAGYQDTVLRDGEPAGPAGNQTVIENFAHQVTSINAQGNMLISSSFDDGGNNEDLILFGSNRNNFSVDARTGDSNSVHLSGAADDVSFVAISAIDPSSAVIDPDNGTVLVPPTEYTSFGFRRGATVTSDTNQTRYLISHVQGTGIVNASLTDVTADSPDSNDEGLFTRDNTESEYRPIFRENQAISGGVELGRFGEVAYAAPYVGDDSRASIVFATKLRNAPSGSGVNDSNDSVLWIGSRDGSVLNPIVREGDAAPGINGHIISSDLLTVGSRSVSFNKLGDMVFSVFTTAGSVVYYRDDFSESIIPVIRAGDELSVTYVDDVLGTVTDILTVDLVSLNAGFGQAFSDNYRVAVNITFSETYSGSGDAIGGLFFIHIDEPPALIAFSLTSFILAHALLRRRRRETQIMEHLKSQEAFPHTALS